MELRRDALVGASEVITGLNQIVKEYGELTTVGTVGNLIVQPNSRNIIPDRVTFTVDLRDIDLERRNRCEIEVIRFLRNTAEKYQLHFSIREDYRNRPKYCADWIQQIMKEEAEILGLNPPVLMSGPFHDALALSEVCDIGMIFVRCRTLRKVRLCKTSTYINARITH